MSKGKPIKVNMGMVKAPPGPGRFEGGRSRGGHKESSEDEVGAVGAETKATEVVEEETEATEAVEGDTEAAEAVEEETEAAEVVEEETEAAEVMEEEAEDVLVGEMDGGGNHGGAGPGNSQPGGWTCPICPNTNF